MDELSSETPQRQNVFLRKQRAGHSCMSMMAETPTENVLFGDEEEEESTMDEMHKSCSTDSFTSVNLNGSEQASGQSSQLKSVNNKYQQ